MAYNSYTIYIAQVAHIRIYMFGILYLVGHCHFLEVAFTLTMPIEIETDRGNWQKMTIGHCSPGLSTGF